MDKKRAYDADADMTSPVQTRAQKKAFLSRRADLNDSFAAVREKIAKLIIKREQSIDRLKMMKMHHDMKMEELRNEEDEVKMWRVIIEANMGDWEKDLRETM
jgi:hypothetical protein